MQPIFALFIPALLSRPLSPWMVVPKSPEITTAQALPTHPHFLRMKLLYLSDFVVEQPVHQPCREICVGVTEMFGCFRGKVKETLFAPAPRLFILAARASDLEELLLFSELTFSHFANNFGRVLGPGSLPVTIPFSNMSEALGEVEREAFRAF